MTRRIVRAARSTLMAARRRPPSSLDRQPDAHAHARPAVALDRAAEGGDPLAHAGQARALAPGATLSVVGHFEDDARPLNSHADGGMTGFCVANDVRTDSRSASASADSYAIGSAGRSTSTVASTPAASRARRAPSSSPAVPGRGSRPRRHELRRVPRGRFARRPASPRGARRIDFSKARSELGFHDDQRQCVAKEVVQVARDALPLGERGEALDLLVGATQASLGALALGIDDVRGPGHDREDKCW